MAILPSLQQLRFLCALAEQRSMMVAVDRGLRRKTQFD
jgi:hypothetical protein